MGVGVDEAGEQAGSIEVTDARSAGNQGSGVALGADEDDPLAVHDQGFRSRANRIHGPDGSAEIQRRAHDQIVARFGAAQSDEGSGLASLSSQSVSPTAMEPAPGLVHSNSTDPLSST